MRRPWTELLKSKTLEEIVYRFGEFLILVGEWLTGEKEEEVKQIEEKKIEEKTKKRGGKIRIHYVRGKELTVFVGTDRVSSSEVSDERYQQLLDLAGNGDTEGIYTLLTPPPPPPDRTKEMEKEHQAKKEIKEELEAETIIKKVKSLVDTGDFEVKGDSVYMKGISRSLPRSMVNKFEAIVAGIQTKGEYHEGMYDGEGLSYLEKEYAALKNFWFWSVLNPVPEVADELYNYLSKFNYKVNKNGFFYAFRNVNKLKEQKDVELIKAITEGYVKAKGWKKNPNIFNVYQHEDKTYQIFRNEEGRKGATDKHTLIGNLAELYAKVDQLEENRYTDAHSKTFDIRIGRKVRMNPSACQWSNEECAGKGLHFTLNLDYYGCGDTSLMILINPATVVGLGSQKGRCYEYLPLCVIDRSQAQNLLVSGTFDTTAIEDADYEEEMKNLETKVKEHFVSENQKYELVDRTKVPVMTDKEIELAVDQLQKNRIKTFE